MALLSRKVKASTLVEVIVAMTIIMVTAIIVTTFIANSQGSLNLEIKIKALTLSDNIMDEYKTQINFNENNTTETKEGLIIQKNISNYPGNIKLKVLTVTIANIKGKTIVTRRKLLISEKQ